MARAQLHQFPCLSDNYGVLIRDPASGAVAAIDVPDADTVAAALKEMGWTLSHILTTHHHADHTQGNLALKAATGAVIIGPLAEAGKIPGIDRTVAEGDAVAVGTLSARVLETPGHTAGHISYWFAEASTAFVGDTVFAMGCGRVIEGTYEMMWASLDKIRGLPRDTVLYCGHEYTVANARFALTIEPGNSELAARAKEVESLRAQGRATLPTRLDLELATNPFLRPESAEIQARLGLEGKPAWQVFAEVRERKNRG